MANVAASFVRFYYMAVTREDDLSGLVGAYSSDSILLVDDAKHVGAASIIAAHQARFKEIGRLKVNLTHVDHTLLSTRQITVHVVGSIISEQAEHHFVQSFTLSQTQGRENTYYVQAEWVRTTNVVNNRTNVRRGKDAEAEVPAPVAPAAPAPAPVARTQPSRQVAAPVAQAQEAPARTTPAPAPAAATQQSEQQEGNNRERRPRAPRERPEKRRVFILISNVPKRTTIGDVEKTCSEYGKVLACKWSGRNAVAVEFLSLKVVRSLVEQGTLVIHGQTVGIADYTEDPFEGGRF
jgi:hypothetical protein